ncbi:MAG: metallophosphoesterase [Anaerolineae bacterium]|jgi:predicted MPP superfamily phosphohydrolase|nr:metallophosphoesterase [Anaerolineae bacterium]MDH7474006.1 metallophosphoesterase [Anaerolineae bacterium]
MPHENNCVVSQDRPLHRALVRVNTLTQLSEPLMILILCALALVAGLLWTLLARNFRVGLAATLIFLLFIAADWLLLSALPRLSLSFGPVEPFLVALAVFRLGLNVGLALLFPFIARAGGTSPTICVVLVGILHVALSLVVIYACTIEPFHLTMTDLEVVTDKLSPDAPPLRILQLSDFHVERITKRDREVLALAERLSPDLIVLTGDYLNLSYVYDETARREARAVLSQLHAPYGVYAVAGSPPVDPPEAMEALFAGLDITVLRDEGLLLNVRGQTIRLLGVTCSWDPVIAAHRLDRALSTRPEPAFTLLLYHSPDIMPDAAAQGVDLVLAGHTHGGQVRLPLYGAVFTSSVYGKRYEMGRYQEGQTVMYVTRGLGMEGLSAPRVRFLCPPEVGMVTIKGK